MLGFASRGPDWAAYLDRLPRTVGDLLDEWALAPDGELLHGYASVVVPVRSEGVPAMLKVAFPDVETEHEALALQHWGGRGAVQLPRDAPVPRRLVEQALALHRDLAADPASTGTLIHHDLHYQNVLAGDREPWLAIDPQPMSGDAHAEPAPMLWNRWDELVSGGSVREGLRRRFHTIVDVAGLDEHRARDWVALRMVVNAYWSVEDADRRDRRLTAEEREWVTRCSAIAKAVQD